MLKNLFADYVEYEKNYFKFSFAFNTKNKKFKALCHSNILA